jgi:hypothetical protein
MPSSPAILEYASSRTRHKRRIPLGPWWFWPSRRSLLILALAAAAFWWTLHRPMTWQIATRIPLGQFQSGFYNYSVAFLDGGQRIIGDFDATTLKIWSSRSGEVLRSFTFTDVRADPRWIVSKDERRLLLLGKTTAQLYGLADGRLLAGYPSPEWGKSLPAISAGVFSPGSDRLLTYDDTDQLRLWDISGERPKLVATQPLTPFTGRQWGQWPQLAFAPGGSAVSCVRSDGIWMGDGHSLTCRVNTGPAAWGGLDSKFSADGKWFFTTTGVTAANVMSTRLDVYDVGSGALSKSWPTGIMGPCLWDDGPTRLLYGIHFTGGGAVAMRVSAVSRPGIILSRGYGCVPKTMFRNGHAILDFNIYEGGPAEVRECDLNTGRQVASFSDVESHWDDDACTADSSALVTTDWHQIKLWRRVGSDDFYGLGGSPRFLSLVGLLVAMVVSLQADAGKRSAGFDSASTASARLARAMLLSMGTVGLIEAVGWALLGWWWWHVQVRWLIDTLLLAALPCGLGLSFGSRGWRYFAIALCLIMVVIAWSVLQCFSLHLIGQGEIQIFDRDLPLNPTRAWSLVIGIPAVLLVTLRALAPPIISDVAYFFRSWGIFGW